MKITKRKEGEWVIDFTLNRKRIRRIIKGTKKMAEQAATFERERIYKQKYRIPEPKKKIRFKDYSKFYHENFTKEKRSRKNEEYVLGQLNSYFKDKFLNEITPGDVDRFKQKGKKRGLKNGTINRQLIVLRAMINKAIDSEDYGIYRNPVNKAGRMPKDPHRVRYMTHDEIKRLMEAAESNPWGGQLPLFLTVAMNTGMRKMEILSMTWSDVDFNNRTITVTHERSKSKKERHVPMNSVVAEALEKVERQNEYVFYNSGTGKHLKHLRTTFKRACREAEIENLTIHDLRHTALSYLANDCGLSIAEVKEIAGHSTIEMTIKYIHARPEKKRMGMDELGKIFLKSRQKVDTTPIVARIEQPQPPHINVH